MEGFFKRIIPLGLVSGAIFSAKLMQFGRKYIFICANFLGLIACFLSVGGNYPVLLFGRALYGFIGGIVINVIPKFLQETIPQDIYNQGYGASTHLAMESYKSIDMLINNYMMKLEK